MKKNLIKLLALTCCSVGLAACTTTKAPKAEEVSLDQIFDYDSETFLTVYEGKTITFEGNVQGKTADNVYVQYCNGDYVSNIYIAEVNCSADVKFMDTVSVTGTVKTVNGRITIADAKVDMVEEYDEAKGEEDDDYYTQHAAYYAGTINKSYFEGTYGVKRYSGLGVIFEGVLASKPETITATSSTEFYVVWAGGNTDVTDEDNEDLLKVTVPAGLAEAQITKYNNYFTNKEVNTGITFYADLFWDNGMGFQFTDTNGYRTKMGDYEVLTTIDAAVAKGVSTIQGTVAHYFPDGYETAFAAIPTSYPETTCNVFSVSAGVTAYYYEAAGIYLAYIDVYFGNGTDTAQGIADALQTSTEIEYSCDEGEYSFVLYYDTSAVLLYIWEDEESGLVSMEFQIQFEPVLSEE